MSFQQTNVNTMSLQKDTVIQFRINKDYKKEIQRHCDRKDLKISEYITKLIRKDLGLAPKQKELICGIDWELE